MKYFEELKKSMEWLGNKDDTLFIGQAVEVPGTAMFNTLKDIHPDKRLELPVFEDTQMGMSIGMSLTGKRVISIFPRWNFLLCATNQLVSHLDKFPIITEGDVSPGIIIRTSVGSQRPLFPGHQHIGNMSSAYREMLSTVEIIELKEPMDIFPSYQKAYKRDDGKSTLLVEFGDYYNEK
tara:strand:+ start:1607 stop:2143 length:537 start_codon:yes stop_codon:yes gene_type:complete